MQRIAEVLLKLEIKCPTARKLEPYGGSLIAMIAATKYDVGFVICTWLAVGYVSRGMLI